MARFVVLGKEGDAEYAEAERIFDLMSRSLPEFHVKKIVTPANEFDAYLAARCKEMKCSHTSSPLVWRESGAGNPNGIYIGGLKALKDMIFKWYGPDILSGSHVLHTPSLIDAESSSLYKPLPHGKPLKVCFLDADSPFVYAAIPHILSQRTATVSNMAENIFSSYFIEFLFVEENSHHDALRGLVLEIEDLATSNYNRSEITNYSSLSSEHTLSTNVFVLSYSSSSSDTNIALEEGVQKIISFAELVKKIGFSSSAKFIVVGEFSSTRAFILSQLIASESLETVSFVSCNKQFQAHAQISRFLNKEADEIFKVSPGSIKQVLVWGADVVDLSHARVEGMGGVVGNGASSLFLPLLKGSKKHLNEVSDSIRSTSVANHRQLFARSFAAHLSVLLCASPTLAPVPSSSSSSSSSFSSSSLPSPSNIFNMGLLSSAGNPYAADIPSYLGFSFPVFIDGSGKLQFAQFALNEESKAIISSCVSKEMALRDLALVLCDLVLPFNSSKDVVPQNDEKEENVSSPLNENPNQALPSGDPAQDHTSTASMLPSTTNEPPTHETLSTPTHTTTNTTNTTIGDAPSNDIPTPDPLASNNEAENIPTDSNNEASIPTYLTSAPTTMENNQSLQNEENEPNLGTNTAEDIPSPDASHTE